MRKVVTGPGFTYLAAVDPQDAEIERLKEQNESDYKITVGVCNENTDLKKLITELAAVVYSAQVLMGWSYDALLQRAREATNGR